MPSLQHKRGTRAQLDTAAAASQLKVGEVYFITDEQRLAVGTAVNAYTAFLKEGEGGGGGGGGSTHPLPLLRSTGLYVSNAMNATAGSTSAGAADRLEMVPFIPSKDVVIDELAFEVTTLLAGSNCKVGLYDSNPTTGLPDARLEGSGDLSCATTGVKTNAITPRTLTAGTLYWLAIHFSSTQTVRAVAVGGCMPIASQAAGTAVPTSIRAKATYASGLPATAPAGTNTTVVAVWVRMRID